MAIKKISNAFEDAIDCKRMLREMRLLQHFKHENVLCLNGLSRESLGVALNSANRRRVRWFACRGPVLRREMAR